MNDIKILKRHEKAALKAYPFSVAMSRMAYAEGMAFGEQKEKERIKKKLLNNTELPGPEHESFYALLETIEKL